MGNKPFTFRFAFVVLALLFGLAGHPAAAKADELAGKTLWVVDVNTNEYYQANLQLALVDQLPQFVPGVIVRHVITADKGNPFFLLKQEDYPDAVIVSLGMCDATSKKIANYASEARKKGIPSAMIYFAEVRDLLAKWNKAYRNSDEQSIEIDTIPQTQQEAGAIVERIAPVVLEKLQQ